MLASCCILAKDVSIRDKECLRVSNVDFIYQPFMLCGQLASLIFYAVLTFDAFEVLFSLFFTSVYVHCSLDRALYMEFFS